MGVNGGPLIAAPFVFFFLLHLRSRIRGLTNLRLVQKLSTSRTAYLNFAEFTIQCLHTSASHLNDRDQRLPTDRPYTNGYFLDLVSQVRRYAALIRANRERVEAAQAQEAQDSNSEKKKESTL
jgi:hypothetical protein